MKSTVVTFEGAHLTTGRAATELVAELSSIPGIEAERRTASAEDERSITRGSLRTVVVGTCDELAGRGITIEASEPESIAYRWSVDSGRLVGYVAAGCADRTVIAVYRALHSLGFRWPDPYLRAAPTAEELASSCPVAATEETPSYRHRGICIEGAVSEAQLAATVRWLPKAGFNGYFIQFREGHTFFDRWSREQCGRSISREEAAAIISRIAPEIKALGLDYHAVGHGWTCEPFGIPGLGWEPHTEPIAEDTARVFAEIDGVRELFGGIALNTNLCFSQESVQQRMSEAVAAYAGQHPEIDFLHVWLADGTNNQCECPDCRNTRPSDFYVEILNRIDAALAGKGLATRIVFLAYVDLFWPPERTAINNPDRFVLMFAPITRSYSSSFATEAPRPPIAPFVRNHLELPKSVEGNLTYLEAWQQQFRGDSFDFDYHLMWDHYCDPGYTGVAGILHQDIAQLESIGLNGFMSCQVQRAWCPSGLPMYVMGATLWDRDRSFKEISDEYYTAAFGERAGEVSSYLSRLTELFLPPVLRGEIEESKDQSDERHRKIIEFLDSTKAFVASLSGPAGRTIAAHHRLLALLAPALHAKQSGDVETANERYSEVCEYVDGLDPEMLDRFDVTLFKRVSGERWFGRPRVTGI